MPTITISYYIESRFKEMHRQDPSLNFPMLVWDTFPKSGASQVDYSDLNEDNLYRVFFVTVAPLKSLSMESLIGESMLK